MTRTAELAQTLVYAIRRRHQPIPEGSGGTGDTPSSSWSGPCAADLEVWPCYASQAADMLERLANRPGIIAGPRHDPVELDYSFLNDDSDPA